MHMKYFMTALATFFSISVAQGASLLTAQLGQGISSMGSSGNLFSQKQPSDPLSKFSQAASSYRDDNREAVVELVSASSSGKRRGHRPKHPKPRPKIFKGPMSYK